MRFAKIPALRPHLFFGLALLAACSGKDGDSGTTYIPGGDSGEPEPDCDLSLDADCDGVPDADDCDPNDPLTYPGATEVPYDGADNDCAGDGDLTDVDGDGYDSDRAGGDDCNDGDPNAYPGAPETCNGRDDDCDGWPTDPDDEASDCDNDGYGPGEGGDCDDEDATVYPGAEDTWYDGVDSDCAGDNDFDADGDGDEHRDLGDGNDCDDTDPATYGDAQELVDGADNDCDDVIDTISQFDAHATYFGTTSSGDGWTGLDIAGHDDLDGDGWRDYALGGPFGDSDYANCAFTDGDSGDFCNGWVQLMGGQAESSDPPGTVAHGRIEGHNSWLGWKLDNPGDLDGDGKAELIVGAPGYNTQSGAVFVFAGADLETGGTIAQSDAAVTFAGSNLIGLEVDHLMDVDGDGVAEIVGSGGFNDQAIGTIPVFVAVWSGDKVATGGTYTTSDAEVTMQGTGVGGEVAASQDFDGDGLGDLVVASGLSGPGALLFVPGTDIGGGTLLSTGDYSGPAGAAGDQFGTHITILSDIDGDGIDDLAASGPASDGAAAVAEGGIVRVMSGADLTTSTSSVDDAIFVIEGTLDYGGLGLTGSRQGDVDGDGTDDLMVAYLGGSAIGVVRGRGHLFYGTDILAGGTVVAEDSGNTFTTRFDGDRFGIGGDIFDIDGDGSDDILLGAPAGSSERGLAARYMSGW